MNSAADVDARVAANTGLVYAIARRFYPNVRRYEAYEDCVQDGMTGLVKAARTFDPARGFHFSTFAHYLINGAMHDGLRRLLGTRDWGAVPMPASLDRVTHWSPDGESITLGATRPDPGPGTETEALGLLWPADLRRYLSRLPTRERIVLERCVMGEETNRALAPQLGISESRVSQLRHNGLARMAAMLAKEGWTDA